MLEGLLDRKLGRIQLLYRLAVAAPSADGACTLTLWVVAGMAQALHVDRSAHPEIDLQAQHTTHLFSMEYSRYPAADPG